MKSLIEKLSSSIYLGDVISSLKPFALLIIIMPFIEGRSLDVLDAHQSQLEAVLNFAKIFPPQIENLEIHLLVFKWNKLHVTFIYIFGGPQNYFLAFNNFIWGQTWSDKFVFVCCQLIFGQKSKVFISYASSSILYPCQRVSKSLGRVSN